MPAEMTVVALLEPFSDAAGTMNHQRDVHLLRLFVERIEVGVVHGHLFEERLHDDTDVPKLRHGPAGLPACLVDIVGRHQRYRLQALGVGGAEVVQPVIVAFRDGVAQARLGIIRGKAHAAAEEHGDVDALFVHVRQPSFGVESPALGRRAIAVGVEGHPGDALRLLSKGGGNVAFPIAYRRGIHMAVCIDHSIGWHTPTSLV